MEEDCPITDYDEAVDFLLQQGCAVVLQPHTTAWQAVVGYSWLNEAMRPSSPRTTKEIVLLPAELVTQCFTMPWDALLSFYLACSTLPEGFMGAVNRLQAEGHDLDELEGKQLQRALARMQQGRQVALPPEAGQDSGDAGEESEGEEEEAQQALAAIVE